MIGKRCPNCASSAQPIFIHSHYQCPACKMNISPCCDGATCEVVDLSWHPVNTPLPAGYELAQSAAFVMHHNHYQALIRKVGT